MADTIHCYNETEICQSCKTNVVQNIHIGTLSDNKPVKVCNKCFKELIEKNEKNRLCGSPGVR